MMSRDAPKISAKNQRLLADPPLQTLLIVPWVTLLIGAVSLVGYLSYRSSQRSIDTIAARFHHNISGQVEQRLDHYLETPKQVNRLNLQAIELGLLNVENPTTIARYFWHQMQIFPTLSYLSYGAANGEFIGIERLDENQQTLLINQVSRKTQLKKLYIYNANAQGERTNLIQTKPWNPQSEAWYSETATAKKAMWSSIFPWEDKPNVMSVTSNFPVFDRAQNITGILSIDLTLNQISAFLKELPTSKTSTIFIAEASGFLVGSSSDQPIYQINPTSHQAQRLPIQDSTDPIIKRIGQYLQKQHPHQPNLDWLLSQKEDYRAKIKLDRQPYYLNIETWRDDMGLTWLVFVVTPESAFMGELYKNIYVTLLMCLLAMGAALLLSVWMARSLTRPIIRLNQASQTIAAGDLEQPVQRLNWGSRELNQLANTFEFMRRSLIQAQRTLADYTKSLETRVSERTAELQASNSELVQALANLKTAQDYLVQSEKLAALGQLAASVAHEINTPLGAIHSSIESISSCLTQDLQKLPALLAALPSDQQTAFLQLLQQSMAIMPNLTVLSYSEKRTFRRELLQQLQQQSIANPEFIADILIDLGVYQSFPQFQALLQDEDSYEILNVIYNIASSHKSAITIAQATESASEFVRALKIYVHTDATPQRLPIQLLKSLENALTLYQNLLKRGITVVRDYPPNVPIIYGFANELQQVWTNLIHNAIQAMPTQGGKLTVTIVAIPAITTPARLIPHADRPEPDPSVDAVRVLIADNGHGIAPAIMSQIFDPFFTTKTAGEGCGLGLSIVQKIIERHQGTIDITSNERGTTVSVTLPICDIANL
jgi:signal transduction histidine kinase